MCAIVSLLLGDCFKFKVGFETLIKPRKGKDLCTE